MAQFENIFYVDLKKPNAPMPLRQMVGEGDSNGFKVGAVVTSDGEMVSLGGSCVGKVVRADGATVQLTGTISGNTAYVVLDQQSCAIEGPIQVAVCWVSSSNVTTLLVAYGTVINTQTGTAIQPSTPIPDLTQLLAEISAMETATAAANAAASSALTNFAGAFSSSTAYTAGQYVTYTDGKFYRFTTNHSAGAWNSAHVVAVTAGGELADLKSAITQNDILTQTGSINQWDEQWANGYYNISTGAIMDNANYVRSKNLIPVAPSTTYYFKTSSAENYIVYFDKNGDFVNKTIKGSSGTFTTPATAYYIGIAFASQTYGNNVSVNYPASDTAYHAFDKLAEKNAINGFESALSAANNTIAEIVEGSYTEWFPADKTKYIFGKYYNHETINPVSSSSAAILPPFKVFQGITYKYAHIYAYFCSFVDSVNSTITALSSSTSSDASGTFTPPHDGLLYLTVAASNNDLTYASTFTSGVDSTYLVEKLIANTNIEWLPSNETEYTFGKYYKHEDTDWSNSPSAAILPPFKAYSGLTYTYAHMYAYFCNFVDGTDGTITALSSSTNEDNSGTFTPPHNGLVYLTVAAANGALKYQSSFTSGKTTTGFVDIYPNTPDIIGVLKTNAGKKIRFNDGTYDIIAIYKSKYGNDYFDNYTGYSGTADVFNRGLNIGRSTEVYCTAGVYFTANYTGSNTAVRNNFAAFALESGVIIDGLNVEMSGLRNVIHDDFDNGFTGTTILRNCNLKGDKIIIAGGFAFHDTIIIENCIFNNTNEDYNFDLSYHNNADANAQSKLVVKDNYMQKGFSIRWYGASTLLSDVMVSNNSMAYAVEKRAENASATIDNINLMDWNNAIRN